LVSKKTSASVYNNKLAIQRMSALIFNLCAKCKARHDASVFKALFHSNRSL